VPIALVAAVCVCEFCLPLKGIYYVITNIVDKVAKARILLNGGAVEDGGTSREVASELAASL
jgi:hypothetical protein